MYYGARDSNVSYEIVYTSKPITLGALTLQNIGESRVQDPTNNRFPQ